MIFKHRFTLIALMTLLMASLAGCSQDEPSQPDEKKGSVILRLAIDTGLNPSSRAEAPDFFEPPSGDFEKIYTLRVILVNNYEQIEANKLVRTTDAGQPIDDNLEFKVETGKKRIYLIANEATLPFPWKFSPENPGAVKTFNSITTCLDSVYRVGEKNELPRYTFHNWVVDLPGQGPAATAGLYSDAPEKATGLPLTEFFDFTVGASYTDTIYDQTQTVQLFLTRAAAKATFNINVDGNYKGSGVNVTGIRLRGLNWEQYVFPRNGEEQSSAVYNPEKNVIITEGLPGVVRNVDRYITAFTTPQRINGVTGANVTMNLAKAIEIKKGTNESVGPIYIPESLMPETVANNSNARFSVQVQLDGENWLDAKPLGVGDGNNILLVNGCQAISRNTHLKVTIGFSDNDITATVQLVPYIGKVLRPGFGFEELDPKQNN